jgi:NAD(P)-dependent dehydrogenase (short-subunit alcohol dehydrogenase family)
VTRGRAFYARVMAFALVSGSNRGLGREIARQLGRDHGFDVIVTGRDPADARRTADELAGEGVSATPARLDVSDPASVDRLAAELAADPGSLDVLVNNAGVGGPYAVAASEASLDDVKELLETNLFGAWRLTQAMIPLLRRSSHPRIVNLSSGMGQLAEMGGGAAAYRVSKTALNALTRIFANEEAGSGVLTNSVCPGWVRTDMGGSGARLSVEEGADTAVWLATLPDDGPTGGFFRERAPIPW